MIKKLHLENFKTFIDEDIDFSKLNVLTGMNSSGKSSIIQAIRILREYGYRGDGNFSLQNHPTISLKSKFSNSDFFQLTFEINDKKVEYKITEISTNSFKGCDIKPVLTKTDYNSISYISADRYGPKNSFEMSNTIPENVGEKGEDVFSFLEGNNNAYKIVPEQLRINKDHTTLSENIDDWLGVVTPGTSLKYTSMGNKWFPKYNDIVPLETGYGLSFSLPVIVSLLFFNGENNSVLLLENPEAHLHPAAQTAFGKLIATSTACGKQIILETHSDHIIDGIRIAAKENIIKPTEAKIYYFVKQTFEIETKIENPELLQDGSLSYWPDGFFDQSLKDKSILIRKRTLI